MTSLVLQLLAGLPGCQPLSACVSVWCAPWPWLLSSPVWTQTKLSVRQTFFSRYSSALTSSSSSASSSSSSGCHLFSSGASEREKPCGICSFSRIRSLSRPTASLDSSLPLSSATAWPLSVCEDGINGMLCHYPKNIIYFYFNK